MSRAFTCLLLLLLWFCSGAAQQHRKRPKQRGIAQRSAKVPIEWAGDVITGSPCYVRTYENALVSEVIREWHVVEFDLNHDGKPESIIYKRDKCACLRDTDLCRVSLLDFYGQRLMASRDLLNGLFVAPNIKIVPGKSDVNGYFDLQLLDNRSGQSIADFFYDWHGSYKLRKMYSQSDAFRITSDVEVKLVFDGPEDFESNGKQLTRYSYTFTYLDPSNTGFPSEIVTVSPASPCSENDKSSPTEVDIYDQRGNRLNRLCNVVNNGWIDQVWFDIGKETIPPSWVFFELIDRRKNTVYRSNLTETIQ